MFRSHFLLIGALTLMIKEVNVFYMSLSDLNLCSYGRTTPDCETILLAMRFVALTAAKLICRI